MIRTSLCAVCLGLCLAAVGHRCLGAEAAADRPNLVIILADDMGHGHASCFNRESKIKTPHIDRLAREGIKLTDAHSGSAVCSPTRYGLLTGRYAWRTRLVRGVLGPYDPPLIEPGRLTVPELLRKQGYQTACIGKWHLGWNWPGKGQGDPDFTQPIPGGPTAAGFDYYFGTDVPNYPPYCFIENDRTVGQPTDKKTTRNLDGRPGPMLPGWQFDQILPRLTEKAVDYLARQAKGGKPFFLYFPLTSPHEPIAPNEAFRGKSGMNALADFILETDWVVGQVSDAIDKNGLADKTLLIFMADNGSSLYTGGEELRRMGHEPSARFRGFKASIYEGGHRVPFIARWPGKIAPGTTSQETICLTDMLATCAALVGTDLPRDAGEDSYNILPVLLAKQHSEPIREATVHQSAAGQLAIRQGPWKLIVAPREKAAKRSSEPVAAELYHLGDDPGETRNLCDEQPEIVARMAALLEKYQQSGRSRP